MNISAISIPVYIFIILLIVGCAFTSREVYIGRTMFIPLKSSPEDARVLLDGRQEGYTPMTLEFTYLRSQYGSSDDEMRKRILKIERDGYEPYILSFSIRDKEYENIPNPVFLKKSEDIVKAKDSLGKEQQKRQELKEEGEALKALKEVKKPVNKIALIGKSSAFIDNTLDSPLKDQHKTQELKEAKEKINNSLEEIDNINKFINNLKVDSQYASNTRYTIQTGSFLKLERAQKKFDSIPQILNGKEISFIRIEKIGKYYTVRIGSFEDIETAKKFMQEITPPLSEAVILKAYIKNERIIRSYG
jgi:cell division protein FtsN